MHGVVKGKLLENFIAVDQRGVEYLILESKLLIRDLKIGDIVEFVPAKIYLAGKLIPMADFVVKRDQDNPITLIKG